MLTVITPAFMAGVLYLTVYLRLSMPRKPK